MRFFFCMAQEPVIHRGEQISWSVQWLNARLANFALANFTIDTEVLYCDKQITRAKRLAQVRDLIAMGGDFLGSEEPN